MTETRTDHSKMNVETAGNLLTSACLGISCPARRADEQGGLTSICRNVSERGEGNWKIETMKKLLGQIHAEST
jgi:hypothetical protein